MRICITTVPFTGMKIDAPLPLEPLNARLQEGGGDPALLFAEAPLVDLTITRTFGGVNVAGRITGQCTQTCATCADAVPHDVTADVSWILQSTSDTAGADDTLDDPGVLKYEGDHIDLEDPLQEALILNLSPFWHPDRDRSEKCLFCHRDCAVKAWKAGKTEEKTTSLGDLLKGALAGKK